jgi:hypothetical protein
VDYSSVSLACHQREGHHAVGGCEDDTAEGITDGSGLGWLDSTNKGCLLCCIDGCDKGTTKATKNDSVHGWLVGTNDECLLGYINDCNNDTTEGIEEGSVLG